MNPGPTMPLLKMDKSESFLVWSLASLLVARLTHPGRQFWQGRRTWAVGTRAEDAHKVPYAVEMDL